MAATRKLMELVEEAVANSLRSNLPAELSTIQTQWAATDSAWTLNGVVGRNVPLPNPKLVYPGWLDKVREYPTVLVVSTGGGLNTDGGTTFSGMQHMLDVVAILESDTDWILDIQTKRYLTAIWEVITKNQNAFDGSLYGLVGAACKKYGRTDIYKNEKGLLVRQAGWEVAVTVDEIV